jgi:hypothetical protein
MQIKITAMAFSRDKWIDRVIHHLEGAIGEYAKIQYAKATNTPDYWSHEVSRIISKINDMFDTNKVKTKQVFDRYKAFSEAFNDASICQDQIVKAKNDFANYFVKREERIEFLKKSSKEAALDSNKLIADMVIEYLDKDILKKIAKYL